MHYSLIDIQQGNDMSAEQKLQQIQKPVENLQLTLSLLTKMELDSTANPEELAAIFISLHKQALEIQRTIQEQ